FRECVRCCTAGSCLRIWQPSPGFSPWSRTRVAAGSKRAPYASSVPVLIERRRSKDPSGEFAFLIWLIAKRSSRELELRSHRLLMNAFSVKDSRQSLGFRQLCSFPAKNCALARQAPVVAREGPGFAQCPVTRHDERD